ncbi:alpha/beta hydrolase [Streptosporangium sp. NPDC000396]|uniref:alpha/beta hydrolase n=1 Tax=Streptosporangium sp. NPDC000396 TaxID=3366185 RepID=UPI0036926863
MTSHPSLSGRTRAAAAAEVGVPDCFRGSGATAYQVADADGARMVALGAGPRGIVFAPISWGDACEWASEAKRLARAGHQVVTFDWGGDREKTVSAATGLLRDRGAQQVAWVGGCMGGTVMLGMADRSRDRPVGVAGVSPLALLGGADAAAGRRYRGELLVLGTADDPLADERRLKEVAGLFPTAELTILPGELHAAEIFTGPRGDTARHTLDAFLGRAFTRVP